MALKPETPARAPGYEAPAVQKAFELLGMVADSAEGLGISELSSALGYSKGTIHGIVQALLKAGVLDQSTQRKKLFLGPAIVERVCSGGTKGWVVLSLITHKNRPGCGLQIYVTKTGKVRPLDVKAGNRILFGKYSGSDIEVDGHDVKILRETDILAKVLS